METKGKKQSRDIGMGIATPKESCDDKNCPFHGEIKVRGRIFTGHVVSAKRHKTAKIEWERRYPLTKYERYERRRSSIHAHNPPCINAKEGDLVKAIECRPLSKTKTAIIVERIGAYVKITGIDEETETKKNAVKKEEKAKKQ